MICKKCGTNNPEGNKICLNCGHQLVKKNYSNLIKGILAFTFFMIILIICLSFVNKKMSKKQGDYTNEKNNTNQYLSIIKSYMQSSIDAADTIGFYGYSIDGKDYPYLIIPETEGCLLEDNLWTDITPSKTTGCNKYFNDILRNCKAYNDNCPAPTGAEIKFNTDGEILNGTYLKYGEIKCTLSNEEITCIND